MMIEGPGRQSVLRADGLRGSFAWGIVAVVGVLALIVFLLAGSPADFQPGPVQRIALRPGLDPDEKLTASIEPSDLAKTQRMYSELTGRELVPSSLGWRERLDRALGGRLSRWRILRLSPRPESGVCFHRDGRFSAEEVKEELEAAFLAAGLAPIPAGSRGYRLIRVGVAGQSLSISKRFTVQRQ